MYNNILLAYDFDNSFNNVPKELENLTAHNDEARVTIFNVIPESDLQASVRYENKHFESLAEEKGEELTPFVQKLEDLGLKVRVRFSTGNIKNCLLTEIEQENYDIVVMSNKRAKPDIKNVLGNVTHKIANSANIPVLIVK
ncbi:MULTISPECIES: universal stress protein [Staphylococcus]|uniref:Universal stress protein n=2 Tax=Staphylococcus TaxID=1279 RepID=A0A1Z3U1X7_9STAP|nr:MULTISPECIES: universal stress protein [Staphylococcus]ASE37024.1 universal stress protein [Staphylococcus pettenkoferi]EHM71514.1 universal stress family protein [Staphylococcus pettenkoferi VCU012]MBX8993780.1 universal stress protein [Staphylococcus pettenkoferi]MCI2792103.1 universal stress protein [Staphylococcus pettenkoferi]MCI2802726.1 universal stress protein [Staphylococcus pettenkoferi]